MGGWPKYVFSINCVAVELIVPAGSLGSLQSPSIPLLSGNSSQPPLTTGEIRKWNTDRIIQHLKDNFPDDLDEEDFDILRKGKIKGCAFLGLTEEKLMAYGMVCGLAGVIVSCVAELTANKTESLKSNPIQSFNIVVKPNKSVSFAWNTNTDEATITELKDKIGANYPEKREGADIANIEISVRKQRTTLTDDKDLRNTLKSFVKLGIKKFTIGFKTQAKPYTAWKIDQVLKHILKTEIEDYTLLPKLDIDDLMKKHPIEEFSDSEKTTFTGNLQKIFSFPKRSLQKRGNVKKLYQPVHGRSSIQTYYQVSNDKIIS
ncbi:hypothetical protein BC936DRAFT_139107 [Jimgerdemannia flammicorona]|uniref:SAM domain-containing protein n=1 Tax=Jimgerdemannia flammicorona TaxID=994334 RepID=A0A433BAN5_9FUNG|nr:hypothetical protein BC936DRAFT_139107 [Jimgerdemannia flammicorona]